MVAEQRTERVIREGNKEFNSAKSNVKFVFHATVDVLAVNDRNQETKCRYLIHKAIADFDGREEVIVAPETELDAWVVGARIHFARADGVELSPAAERFFRQLISFDTSAITNDKLYGSDVQRRVGESWNADAELILALAKEQGQDVKADEVSSVATLEAVRRVDGELLFVIGIETDVVLNPVSPIAQAEPGTMSANITQTITMRETPSKLPIAQTHRIAARQVLQGKDGTQLAGKTLDGVNIESRKIKYQLLPASDDKKQRVEQ